MVCGLAPNAPTLVAARAVQGLAGAGLFATTGALLNATYAGRDRGVAVGAWGAMISASEELAPVFKGLLIDVVSWRAIFFINVPVSVLAVLLARRAFEDVRPSPNGRVDWAGMVTSGATSCALVYGLIRANDEGWSDGLSRLLLAGSGVLLIGFVAVQRRSSAPMLDLSGCYGIAASPGCWWAWRR